MPSPRRAPSISTFCHLADMPRAGEALHMLKRVASLVKPVMRARNFHVKELAEFFPANGSLLGLNVDRGGRICLRLRHPGDTSQFLPFESVADTMLHELCHNVHGPHDQQFHALWDQLRDELQSLMLKGYTGEGFLSAGRRLGGSRLPAHELHRLARKEAEGRRTGPPERRPGHRLGGRPPRPGEDIRSIIVDAVERRNRTLQGCGTDKLTDGEIRAVAASASRNGFRTQADEDEANEAAMSQALWELSQEEELAQYGRSYTRPSAENPTGNGAGSVLEQPASSGGSSSRAAPAAVRNSGRAFSRGMTQEQLPSWSCNMCTLQNPPNYLCCDACGGERSAWPGQKRKGANGPKKAAAAFTTRQARRIIDLTAAEDGPGESGDQESLGRPKAGGPATWTCSFCSARMDRTWWTCSTCGKMKEESR